MTGRYAANAGLTWPIFPGNPGGIPANMATLPEALRQNGYNTGMSGKWHLGNSQWKQTPVGKHTLYTIYTIYTLHYILCILHGLVFP